MTDPAQMPEPGGEPGAPLVTAGGAHEDERAPRAASAVASGVPGTGATDAEADPGESDGAAGTAEPRDVLVAEVDAALDDVERELAAVSRALERLDAGNYGACEECGAPLDAALLERAPTATRCERHG